MVQAATTRPPAAGDRWRVSMGATLVEGGAAFRVWAPEARSVEVVIDDLYVGMTEGEDGIWSAFVPGASAGDHYRFRLDEFWGYPDPYSRYQPEGPHGPSEIVDPDAYEWGDQAWPGLSSRGLALYECHVGVHTPDGTFDALIGDLNALRDIGINAIELLPVADFPGARNWGYDGVNLFAPSRNYGGPEALRRLVDAAHQRGIGIILDVVYNHFGPDGNYLLQYSPDYLTDRHHTPWGAGINYDGPNSEAVRRYVLDNARYWLDEYHIDGLRLDATFAIRDDSPRHILSELTDVVRASTDREIVIIAETYENDARYVLPTTEGGFGFDAVWCDDFHHVVHTAASHENSGYYRDYQGTLDELARTINQGWLYQGEHSPHLGEQRGTPAEAVDAHHLVYFAQNHDQVGNRAFGRRFSHLVGAGAKRPWSALYLLLPYTPMLFAGEEFAASARFYYFTDHSEDLGRGVVEGRQREYAQFTGFAEAAHVDLPDPQDESTFLASKLNLEERRTGMGAQMTSLYTSLLGLRRYDPVLRRQDRRQMLAIAASEQLLLVHMWNGRDHRLIALNIGVAIDVPPAAAGIPNDIARLNWKPVISTEERRFGGTDDQVRLDHGLVSLPPHTAAFFSASEPSPVNRLRDTVTAFARRLRGQRGSVRRPAARRGVE